MIHAWAWTAWAVGALVVLSATRNPAYLGLSLACIAVVARAVRAMPEAGPAPLPLWRFALIAVSLSALFNMLSAHAGRHLLLRLPGWLPLIGGPLTLEALVYGALNGLILAGILAAFVVLFQAVPARALVRLIPRAFYQVAVVVSIALTYVPTTVRQFHQIREAQAIRGHRMRGLRDWLPLFMPLLVGGLERALQLAEAMVARGFASSPEQAGDPVGRLVVAQGLLALLIGWLLRLVWGQAMLGLGLMLAGAGLVLVALWLMGRRVPHTDYRPQAWTGRDWAVLLGAVLAAAPFLLGVPGLDRQSIFYYPYPVLRAPGFNPLVGAAILGLLVPWLILRQARALEEVPA